MLKQQRSVLSLLQRYIYYSRAIAVQSKLHNSSSLSFSPFSPHSVFRRSYSYGKVRDP